MTPGNFILDQWAQQQQVFYETLAFIRNKPSKNPVHDFRVSIKKMRSFLRLREIITGENWKQDFSETKKLFAILGRHRDVEMSIGLLNKFSKKTGRGFPLFQKYLRNIFSLTKPMVKEAVAGYNESGVLLLSEKMVGSMTSYPNEQLQTLIQEEVIKILKAVNSLAENFKANAHEIRKLLKDAYYWLKACKNNPLLSEAKMKELDRMLNELGSWQDHFVFDNKIKSFRKELLVKGTEDYHHLMDLGLSVSDQKETLLLNAAPRFTRIWTGVSKFIMETDLQK